MSTRVSLFGFTTMACVLASVARAGEVSFTADVMAVLSKAGCNMGACHGNANGKGGFKLSLRGQDPEFDYQWLTRESDGRRINLLEPERSLILLKPTGQLSHQGGVRFEPGSLEYQMLHDWIVAGAPGPGNEPTVKSLSVVPCDSVLVEPAESLQLSAIAQFSDGSERDVRELATYELSNLSAAVDRAGRVRRQKFGEITVVVRYLDQQVPVRLAFVPARKDFVWSEPAENNFIDALVFRKLQTLRINPSYLSSDSIFVRRAYLDAIGLLPTADEARQFVADTTPDKRDRLVEQLVARPEFAEHWALKWSDILRNEEKVLDAKGVEAFHGWIRDSIAEGKPLDQFVRELIRARGSSYKVPAANFWRANRDSATRAETTARIFLGARLQCARCHNHPFDRWTQDDYYAWAALFSRIDYEIVENNRRDRLDKNEFIGEQLILIKDGGGMRDPRSGRFVWPKLLGDRPLGPGSYHDRLTPLAVWLTSPDNPTFAQVQANFVWYHLLGRGIVEPIDDFRVTNPATNPALLDALARHFVDSGYQLQQLVSTILRSRTYQLAAEPNATNREDEGNFSRALVYRLPAEKLLDAQTRVLDTPTTFAGYKRGLRAGQIPGVQRVRPRDEPPAAGDRFLKTFGKPERLLACECERSNETTLSQAFMLIGGDLNERLQRPDNRLARLLESGRTLEQIVDELYWAALSRPPTGAEHAAAREYLGDATGTSFRADQLAWSRLFAQLGWEELHDERFSRVQDLAWALLNSKEFVFRH